MANTLTKKKLILAREIFNTLETFLENNPSQDHYIDVTYINEIYRNRGNIVTDHDLTINVDSIFPGIDVVIMKKSGFGIIDLSTQPLTILNQMKLAL